jgi:hypothetical protein
MVHNMTDSMNLVYNVLGYGHSPNIAPSVAPTFDPSAYNPWFEKVASPTFVSAAITVTRADGTVWTGPSFQATDIETVLGRKIDSLLNYSGAAPIPPDCITSQLNSYVAMFPSLYTPNVSVWGPLADQLVTVGRAHNPSLPKV